MPIGAMVAREDMDDAFFGAAWDNRQFAHGHTFAGNPLAAAVGIAVIDSTLEEELHIRARRLGEHLAGRLEQLRKYEVVCEIRGCGGLRGVERVRDTRTMEPLPELGAALRRTALDNGLIPRVDPSWFAVSPALVATESDIDEMCDLIEKSLAAALRSVRDVQMRAGI